EWMHVAMVANRDEGTLKIFVNGVEQASRTIRGGNTYQNTNPLWITHTTSVGSHISKVEGAVDSMRLWNVARTPAEIAAGMADPAAPGSAGLLYALDFESTALSGGAILRTLNPNGVSGRIDTPGQTRSYTFSLAA